jgi:beta-N-acetylhexosaminidase
MNFLLVLLMFLLAIAFVPFAWDWRSPFLAPIRSWALLGSVTLSVSLIVGQIWALRTSQPGERALRVLSALGLLTAALVLITTLTLEARFQWVRHQVLQADPGRLEKLGRHVIVGYGSEAELQELVGRRAITGLFVSSRNVRGKSVVEVKDQIQRLQNQRQEQGLPPLWIATDQEGGVVSKLSPPLTRMPALSEIVKQHADVVQRQQAVRQFGLTQGRELAGIGVNLNFAPVVDLNHGVKNPNDRFTHISQRAISRDPAVVAQVAAWYCAALEESGVRCTLKHFPGLGRVFEDTHSKRADLTTSVAELSKTDWIPFRALMRDTNVFTMLAHVRLTELDSERPVSISAPAIAGMLRGEWKYDGVLITDDFSMGAIYASRAGMEHSSIEALNAGVDLILISYDPDQYYRVMYALLQADEQGRLSPELLQQSDQRLSRQ